MRVLVINPGATSTKLAIYEEDREIWKNTIEHNADELNSFPHVIDQSGYREKIILETLESRGLHPADFDAVCGRGGLFRHIPSGVYAVNDAVLEDARTGKYGEHASNLGVILAKQIAARADIPAFFVDPVCVDEMMDVARISGLNGIERQSFFHALNHKSTARKASALLGKKYEELNLVVVHLGGGVSVAAHQNGRVIDVYNVKDDGSMGMDRAGAIPANALVDLCFSGKSKQEVKKLIGAEAGVFSYLGTKDFREVEQRAYGGDQFAMLIFKAFAYQLARDIGAMAAAMCFNVDAIVLTGGIAYSDRFCSEISSYVAKLAKVICFPGEEEMRSLAEGALRILHGEKALEY